MKIYYKYYNSHKTHRPFRPGKNRTDWEKTTFDYEVVRHIEKYLSLITPIVEAHVPFEAEYLELLGEGPPKHFRRYSSKERGLVAAGLWQTKAGKAFDERIKRDRHSWQAERHPLLRQLQDRYRDQYGEAFKFWKTLGPHSPGPVELDFNNARTVKWYGSELLEEKLEKERLVEKLCTRVANREEKEVATERKRKKDRERSAIVAGALGKSRNVAASVKTHLPTNHPCPYCGAPLGSNYHADHIYPVAKGGLSTEQNMVNVCAKCNLTKGQLTLSAFVRNNDLDRDVVEGRLHELGKEY